jgi:hypothetical protein
MKKYLIFGLVVIALFLGGGVYFGFGYKKCEEISPPKMGQQDTRIIERDGKLYFCRSYFEKLLNLKSKSPKLKTEEIKPGAKEESGIDCEDAQVPPGATLTERQYWINLCYQNKAIETKNINLCDKMGELQYTETNLVSKDKCKFEVLKLKEKFEVKDCNILSPGEFRDKCFNMFTQRASDISPCENLESGYDKAECIAEIAYLNNDVSLCDNINTVNDRYGNIILVKEDCYRALAILNKEPNLCNKIPQDSTIRADCYIALAKKLKKPELCNEAGLVYKQEIIQDCRNKAK